MRKKILILFVILFSCQAILNASNFLVEINNKTYTPSQFKIWWKFWKDKNTPFPSTPDKFIDWILLSNEAKAMGFDEDASYKRKINIFLQVRSLLQLRYDEVEKKLNINPDALWKFYEKKFAPFYAIKTIVTDNKTEAEKWRKVLKNQKDFNMLFEKLRKKGKARDLGWKRPVNIPKKFKETIFNSKKNQIYGPIYYKNNFYFVMVTDKFAGTKEDYQKIHKSVAYNYRKYMENKLTLDLIKKLKKKYPVKINYSLINKIKPFDNISNELKGKTVIEIGDKKLSAEKFKKDLEKDIITRNLKSKLTDNMLKKLKKNLTESIISQTLTTIESLNRHYENNVMKDIFWFYSRNRLIKEFENKVFIPKIKISEKDIKEYYNKHKSDFTTPDLVEIAVIQTHDEKLIKNAYKRIRNGEDFFEVARSIQFHGARPETRRLDNLVKELRDRIKNMRNGEISPIIKYKDWFFIVKLIKKKKHKLHEFSKVKKSIKNILFKQQFDNIENKYLTMLRKKSKIKINWDEWKKLKKEFGGVNE